MSYEIIYNKQFIKLSDGNFIPLIYAGSSNCYEYSSNGRERRERSWFSYNFICDGDFKATEVQMLSKMDEYRNSLIDRYTEDDKYCDSMFGYYSSLAIDRHTTKTSFKKWQNIVKFGVKRALTLKQLIEEGVVIKIGKYEEGFWRGKVVTCEEDMDTVNDGFNIMVEMSEWRHKYLMKKHFPIKTKKNEYIESNCYYTIKSDLGYLLRLTKYGYKYSHWPQLKLTANKSQRKLKQLQRDRPNIQWTVKRIDEKATLKI